MIIIGFYDFLCLYHNIKVEPITLNFDIHFKHFKTIYDRQKIIGGYIFW